MDLENRIIKYIITQHLGGDDPGLDVDTPILEWNIIDSIAILDLVRMVGDEAGVEVPFDQVMPDNFGSVRLIARLVGRLRAQPAAIGA